MSRRDDRKGFVWLTRQSLGVWCQHAAWQLLDPYDDWVVDYRLNGTPYGRTVHGRYSTARAAAKELHGRVVGCQVAVIPE